MRSVPAHWERRVRLRAGGSGDSKAGRVGSWSVLSNCDRLRVNVWAMEIPGLMAFLGKTVTGHSGGSAGSLCCTTQEIPLRTP